jgi:hypothetical protein
MHYSRDLLSSLITSSTSKAEVIRKLGFKGNEGGHYRTLNKYIELFDIDTSHFKGQGWNAGLKMQPKPQQPLEEVLIANSWTSTSNIKRRLLQEGLIAYECSICGITSWNGKPISLHLDHINGRTTDNRLENLRLLCPNCHSQTPTYCRAKDASGEIRTRNTPILSGRPLPIGIPMRCKHCETDFVTTKRNRKFCSTKCYHDSTKNQCRLHARKVHNRPTQQELKQLLQNNTFVAVGKMFGVSDNAVRKWLLHYSYSMTNTASSGSPEQAL